MSKKQLKELRKVLPNLTTEQTDAFDKFYKEQPNDAFKTFDKQEDFETYKQTIIEEGRKELQDKVQAYELKEKQTRDNNIMDKLNLSNDKQKTLLSKLTDLSEIKEDEEYEANAIKAYQATMKEYSEAFNQKVPNDNNAKKQLETSSSDIFGASKEQPKETSKSDVFD